MALTTYRFPFVLQQIESLILQLSSKRVLFVFHYDWLPFSCVQTDQSQGVREFVQIPASPPDRVIPRDASTK